MKKLILAAIIATAGFFSAAPKAEAGGFRVVFSGSGYSGSSCHVGPRYHTVRLIRTYEICRRCETRFRYDHCGRRIYYRVTTVTYKSIYSNGTSRIFTRTFYS